MTHTHKQTEDLQPVRRLAELGELMLIESVSFQSDATSRTCKLSVALYFLVLFIGDS